MNPTVSIIVPVYNAERTIVRCVDSILNQEYTDFELLLVNDGSKDNSGAICDGYAAQDSRVRVIHKENSGVSDARNIALDQACGTYLQFLDSDDWITPNATRLFVETAEKYHCDMVISDFYRVCGERVAHKGDIEDDCVLTQEEFAAHMIENPADFYYGVLWNKLFRRDIVEKYHLRMDSAISWCEDFMFNLEYLRHVDIIYALQVPIYYYVKTKGSLASQSLNMTKTIKMKLMVFEYYNNFYKHVLTEEDYEKNRLQVYRFLVDAAGDNAVPPLILPGSHKLGDERSPISEKALSGEGFLMDSYRDRKLLDYYLEPIAIQYGLELKDVRLLLHINQMPNSTSRKELADFAGISTRSLAHSLQKFLSKGYLKIENKRQESVTMDTTASTASRRSRRELDIHFLPTADPLLEALAAAQSLYEQARFESFTEEELVQYASLNNKVKQNIQTLL